MTDEWSSKFSDDLSTHTSYLDADEALRSESPITLNDDSTEPDQTSESASVKSSKLPVYQPVLPPDPASRWIPDSELSTIIDEAHGHLVDSVVSHKADSKSTKSLKDVVLSTLAPLFLEYQSNISKVASIPISAAKPSTTTSAIDAEPLEPIEAEAV